MNRQERDNYDYDRDYSGNAGYSPNDEHYHSARNLTNEFEQRYRRERGYQDDDRDQNRFGRHQNSGRMGSAYDQYRREDGGFREHPSGRQQLDRDRNSGYSGNYSRDRFSNYQDDDYRNQQMVRRHPDESRDNSRGLRGNIEQGYGISDFGGTSDRFNTLDSDRNRSRAGYEQGYGSRESSGNTRFGGMGESSTHSDRGIPNYGTRNFADKYSAGTGSSYGGSNYGGGTGYSGGHRGGTLGSSSYGTTSGNYGGYGPMGGSTYGGGRGSSTGDTAHNSDRTTNELGGF